MTMTTGMKKEPTLEDALDGLQNAETFCFEYGMENLGYVIATLYQRTALSAPDECWDSCEDLNEKDANDLSWSHNE